MALAVEIAGTRNGLAPLAGALHKKSISTRLVSDPLPVASLQRLSPFVRGTLNRAFSIATLSPLQRGTAAGANRPAGGRSQAIFCAKPLAGCERLCGVNQGCRFAQPWLSSSHPSRAARRRQA